MFLYKVWFSVFFGCYEGFPYSNCGSGAVPLFLPPTVSLASLHLPLAVLAEASHGRCVGLRLMPAMRAYTPAARRHHLVLGVLLARSDGGRAQHRALPQGHQTLTLNLTLNLTPSPEPLTLTLNIVPYLEATGNMMKRLNSHYADTLMRKDKTRIQTQQIKVCCCTLPLVRGHGGHRPRSADAGCAA